MGTMNMAKYRSRLPQLGGGLFLSDGGIETTLIFHERLELPYFAAFHLLRDASAIAPGVAVLGPMRGTLCVTTIALTAANGIFPPPRAKT